MTNGEKAQVYSDEIRHLASINERFDNEPIQVQEMRLQFAELFGALIAIKAVAGNGHIARDTSIAITELQKACMFAIKCTYDQEKRFDKKEELKNELAEKMGGTSDSNPLGQPMQKRDGDGPV